jgi:hypothetical protein
MLTNFWSGYVERRVNVRDLDIAEIIIELGHEEGRGKL